MLDPILPYCDGNFFWTWLLQSEVNKKINKAFCPPGIVEANPCLEYIKQIILPWSGKFVVLRTEDNGGNK